ncbi:MAG: hypothetical protein EBZ58_03055 [Bacteroidetes bacterium]|jgi:hypothetical protein|nr:hypothetical protein [Bacteroidota bacterium]
MDPIECSFIPIKKSKYAVDEEMKDGLYSSSVYNVEGFGVTKWVVCAYLKVEHKKLLDEGTTSKALIDGCLAHLNYMPEGARKTKKAQKPKYGNLQPLVSKITGEYDVVYKDDRVIVQLVTDDRQNPHFWGEGDRI